LHTCDRRVPNLSFEELMAFALVLPAATLSGFARRFAKELCFARCSSILPFFCFPILLRSPFFPPPPQVAFNSVSYFLPSASGFSDIPGFLLSPVHPLSDCFLIEEIGLLPSSLGSSSGRSPPQPLLHTASLYPRIGMSCQRGYPPFPRGDPFAETGQIFHARSSSGTPSHSDPERSEFRPVFDDLIHLGSLNFSRSFDLPEREFSGICFRYPFRFSRVCREIDPSVYSSSFSDPFSSPPEIAPFGSFPSCTILPPDACYGLFLFTCCCLS